MFPKAILGLAALTVALVNGLAIADELPYKSGPVTEVDSIKVKEGKFLDYWAYLSGPWRKEMEEAKKQGIVLSYRILSAPARTPQDPDIFLVVTYPNMATLDVLDEKMAIIEKSLWGSLKESNRSSADRDAIRTILGTQFLRELQFRN